MNNPLKLRRVSARMTQAQLASEAGISQQLLSHLENGHRKMTPERAQEIARILGCSAVELLPILGMGTQPETDTVQEFEILAAFRSMCARDRDNLLSFAQILSRSTPERATTN